MKHVVIIGNGVAGITAARHIRKWSDFKITVISSETRYFFSRTALMYIYMGHLTFDNTKPYEDWFWKKNRIDLVFGHVEKVETPNQYVQLQTGERINYDTLIIASGSRSNFFDWPGQDLPGVQGLYSYPDLLRMEANTRKIKNAVVVGGGLIAVEMAEMLRSRKINVTILVRERAFWNNVLPIQESEMISRHIESHGVNLLHSHELKAILSGKDGRVRAVLTTDGEEIPCDFAGLAVGVHPNVSWLEASGINVNKGVLVNEHLQTNIPEIYAIGDCAEKSYELPGRNKIEQVWYTARMMGEVVAQTICGDKTRYEPGPWFNSAKFFDIEYQTYGTVNSSLKENEEEVYWEHSDGSKAMHLIWEQKTKKFLGINSFGIRLRHEKFDLWLREARKISFVIDHLPEANFDPEFSERYERQIRNLFLQKPFLTTAEESGNQLLGNLETGGRNE
jgi:NADPH-dependent 2,4-dienoyl-CoA reductase/sulfur reductase-like enzyme